MFPSEAYLALCKEHKKELREEWKKRGWRPDDWFYNPKHEEVHLLAHSRTHDIWFRDAPKRFARFLEHNIPLPSQRQLIELLEERGWFPDILPKLRVDGSKFCRIEARKRLGDSVLSRKQAKITVGPDPETALLKALMEVMKDDIQRAPSDSRA